MGVELLDLFQADWPLFITVTSSYLGSSFSFFHRFHKRKSSMFGLVMFYPYHPWDVCIFTYVNGLSLYIVNVCKYTIHECYGLWMMGDKCSCYMLLRYPSINEYQTYVCLRQSSCLSMTPSLNNLF